MPADRRLSTLGASGADVVAHVRRLARLIAGFHAAADRSPAIAAEGSSAAVRRRWTANLRETEAFRGTLLDQATHARISALALDYLAGREAFLDARAGAGMTVDGHGDLIAADVFCLPDGPRVLDCLEFDDRLRWVDVADDVAFLAMDLEHLGRPDLADRFVGWYVEFSGTPSVPSLQHHYIAYRAFVRAKVACLRATQGQSSAALDATAHADLALRHLLAGQVTLTLVGGPPGTGKSTLAGALADRSGAILLSTDAVRGEFADVEASDRYGAAAKVATYERLLDHARRALECGESVVADATWGDRGWRVRAAEVAVATSSRLVALQCRVPVEVAAARAQARLDRGGDRSEAGADVARALAARFDPWPGAVGIDTSGSPAEAVTGALAAMTAGTGDAILDPVRVT